MRIPAAVLSLCLAAPAFAGTPAEEVARLNAAFAQAMVKGDAAALGALYTEDAQLLFFDGSTHKGRPEIQAFLADLLPGMALKAATLTSEDARMSGDLIVDVGHYETTSQAKDGTLATSRGRYLQVLARGADGRWRLLRDCPLSN